MKKRAIGGDFAKLAVVAAAAGMGVMSYGGVTVNDYIKDGLVGFWDAEHNQGADAEHDSAATTWVDLSGKGQTATIGKGAPIWGANAATGAKFMNPKSGTGTGAYSYYEFTPCAELLALSQTYPASFTWQHCIKVLTWVTDGRYDTLGGYMSMRPNVNGSGYFNFMGSEGSNYGGSKQSYWTGGMVDSISAAGTRMRRIAYQGGSIFADQTASPFGHGTKTSGNYGRMGGVDSSRGADVEFYTLRYYNRPLNRLEIAYNAAIDAVRYLGGAVRTKVNYCSLCEPDGESYGTMSPSYNSLVAHDVGSQKTVAVNGLTTYDDGIVANKRSNVARAVFDGSQVLTIAGDGTETRTDHDKTVTSHALTLDKDTSITWKWHLQYALKASAPGGTLKLDGGEAVESVVKWPNATDAVTYTLTAVPGENMAFATWTGDVTDLGDVSSPTITVPMTKGRTIVATFMRTGKGDGSTYQWTGGGSSSNWLDPANWDRGMTPLEDDVVVLAPSAAKTIELAMATPRFASLTIGGGGGAVTMKLSGWETSLNAGTVTIADKGVVSPLASFTASEAKNRVHIVCDDFNLAAGGKIAATGLGYGTKAKNVKGEGPGGGKVDRGGAGYGGRNGRYMTNEFGEADRIYGTAAEPTEPGSSGGTDGNYTTSYGGCGGGAVRIEATNHVQLDGVIEANGMPGGNYTGAGSGGAVYITSKTFDGAGSISAMGGSRVYVSSGGGGGGRIAVVWSDTSAQAAYSPSVGMYTAARRYGEEGGCYSPNIRMENGEEYFKVGQPGSIYLTDSSVLTAPIGRYCGQLSFASAPSELTLSSADFEAESAVDTTRASQDLYLANMTVKLADGFVLPKYAHIALDNCDLKAQSFTVDGGCMEVKGNCTIDVTGDMTLQGTGRFLVVAGALSDDEESPWSDFYGATVNIGGKLHLKDTSVLIPGSDALTGAATKFAIGNLTIDSSAKIYGRSYGFGKNQNNPSVGAVGIGPGGATAAGNGAAYGGVGGGTVYNTKTYGDELNPTQPGSEGAHSSGSRPGGWGGSIFYAEVAGRATINGSIDMSGANSTENQGSGGSGGAINLRCLALIGSGSLVADGGKSGAVGDYNGGGGGGRIAVRAASYDDWAGTESADGGALATAYACPAGAGTIRYLRLAIGTMMLIK